MAELDRPYEGDGDRTAFAEIVTHNDPGGGPVVTVSGEIDLSNTAELEAKVAEVTAGRPDTLVFDLSELRFMDSAGIAVLLGAASRVGNVRLRAPSPAVARVVELTGLTEVLEIEP
jgi:anti-sigma B factor antagonist